MLIMKWRFGSSQQQNLCYLNVRIQLASKFHSLLNSKMEMFFGGALAERI